MATYPPPLPPKTCEDVGHLFNRGYPNTYSVCRLCKLSVDGEKLMVCSRCSTSLCLNCLYKEKMLLMIAEDMQSYTIDMDEFETEEPADD